ncbi:F-box only protein 40 [Denticeps clupeoides]|uniref:Uncharacterized protein n=1 Tax=Denticeps clupeoides TaxID=299321 RepID=A0AAY4E2M7_9TELE|nr:F-box only protein 40-like [Denticeps clupeoides]XP_028818273.1 F-box only protein 40-like [Denticeps clupeoides]
MGGNRKSAAGLHTHCEKCFNRYCRVPVEVAVSCLVVDCRLHCGASFHMCKGEEHQLLCPNEKVPCLNADYGCSLTLHRHRLAQHLEVCPASVVSCSLEWNRWPVSESDTVFYKNVSADPVAADQLDVAMAFRDQRLLFRSIKMQKLFPELVEREKEVTRLESAGAVGGLTAREGGVASFPQGEVLDVCAEDSETLELTQEEREALAKSRDITDIENYTTWERIFRKEMEGCKQTAKNLQQNPREGKSSEANSSKAPKEAAQGSREEPINSAQEPQTGLAPWQDGVLERLRKEVNIGEFNMYLVHHGCMLINFGQLAACTPREKDFVYGDLEPIEVETLRSFNVPTSFRAKRCHWKNTSGAGKCFNKNVDTSDLRLSIDKIPVADEVQATLLCALEKELRGHPICEAVGTDGLYVDVGTQTYNFPSAPFRSDASLADVTAEGDHNLHVQTQTECVTMRHNQSSSVFTCLCDNVFRRKDYASHFRNVHSDIQFGLNGWFLQRCPLAYLGCKYSQRRFQPSTYRARVSYAEDLNTFSLQPEVPPVHLEGVKKMSSERARARNLDSLSRLPFEVLRHVAGFLDSYSLYQLSLVSQLLREVCSTLVQERGMVLLKWEKKTYSHGGWTWRCRKKVWQFSCLFSRVDKWTFDDVPSMSQHLKVCPYYQMELRSEPVALASMDENGDMQRQSLVKLLLK